MEGQHASQSRKVRRAAASVGLAAVLLAVLLGCSSGPSRSGLAPSAPGAPAAGAAPRATWSVVRCSAPALPAGWTWYRDARYPFRIAAPPLWRIGTFEYTPDGSNLGAASPAYTHVVDFLGPGSPGQAASSGKDRFDGFAPVIIIDVGVGPRARIDGVTQNPTFHAQPAPVCLGGTPVTLYAFTSIDGGTMRFALLPLGPQGYPYAFTVASHADTAVGDGQRFLTMLATFSRVAAG
jgi:hypothetical protein